MLRRLGYRRWLLSFALILPAAMAGAPAAHVAADAGADSDYVVVYGSPGQASRTEVEGRGHKVAADLSAAGVLVVRTTNPADLSTINGVIGVAPDEVLRVPDDEHPVAVDDRDRVRADNGCATTEASCPLQWDLARIHVPRAWDETRGSPNVRVAVLDTGLRTTHEEVGANFDLADSRSFIPKAVAGCPAETGTIEDGNGHGTWTATHVAGVNGALMTGIAPRTTLIIVKVLSDCGSGSFTAVMAGMMYANSVGARIESMSLGGYLCADGVVPDSTFCGANSPLRTTSNPILWQAMLNIVQFLHDHGTLVVAAAGNDHVRLGATGRVTANGSLAFAVQAASKFNDLRGLAEAPGGVPGVFAVAALNRTTAAGTAPETKFGQFGVGSRDQLTYFSSYGERIDVAAPGGARNFNVPAFDCLTNNCRRADPSAAGRTDNPEDFGAWGVNPATNAPCNDCYVDVQGTSMATPQVAGVAALALAANGDLTTDGLARLLRRSVTSFANPNATPAIATDPSHSRFFNFDEDYGATGVSPSLMGSGVIDARLAVRGGGDN
ncbi:MAG: hypothetical protein E6I75_01830 [Chloroflexi bacterium]|nr:MAG: hypothetical protein E6I75_01830 [Chloroflexota bacterium]